MADRIEGQGSPTTDAGMMEPVPHMDNPPAEPAPKAPPAVPATPQSIAAQAPAPTASPAAPQASPAAQPAPAQPQSGSAQTVPVEYNGQRYELAPDIAAAWNHRQEAFDDGFGSIKEELDAVKQQLNPPVLKTELTEEEENDLLATRFLTEPKRVLEEFSQKLEEKLSQKYQSVISVREFQTKWWSDNKELLPYKDVFDGLLMANAQKFMKAGMTDAQAYDKNAESVRNFIVSAMGNSSSAPSVSASQHVEAPAPTYGAQPMSEPAAEVVSVSISDVMREASKRKSEAALNSR